MYWFHRPPYFRYAAAGLLVLLIVAIELRPTHQIEHPFFRQPMAAGSELSSEDLEVRAVPPGLFPETPMSGRLVVAVEGGEPVLPSMLAPVSVPEGWWTIHVELPAELALGTVLRLKSPAAAEYVPGVLTGSTPSDAFANPRGLVAVPPEWAPHLAEAERVGTLVVIVAG